LEILKFPAVEPGDGIDYYDFVATALGIVTGNTFSTGWLALRSVGNDGRPIFRCVERPADGILYGRVYYWCVGEEDPVSRKSFPQWLFDRGLSFVTDYDIVHS
jgi:hypothetical protein